MNVTQPTPILVLNDVLRTLVSGLQASLGDNLVAFYLQGSFALGDWDADSDVDYLIAIRRPLTDAELGALQALHSRVYDLETDWAKHLEGSYFPPEILRRADVARTPLWFLNNGSRELEPSPHCNALVVRWITREYGIALVGPPAATLIDPVDPDSLRREVFAKLRAWAADYAATPAQLNNRWDQPYAVITFCRMLHTLETGRVASKPASVRWGQGALDPQWRDLLQRAWDERPNPTLKIRTPADPAEVERTIAFLRYALSYAEGRFAHLL
jgi:predicted nucleotidyltransferase